MGDNTQNYQEEVPTASVGVWIGLIVISGVSFWCQAAVTEERFVPALNVIATEFKIPHDIAGATLMAAGASSPELFSSIVSLFITHSSLGLGTIVGSEIFNQLIICAGAVYASRTGHLQLDPAIVTREVGFYALSIVLLYFALQDTRPDPDDNGAEHIYISFWDSVMVFGGYVAYVIVCANMEAVVRLCTCSGGRKNPSLASGSSADYGSTSTGGRSAKKVNMDMGALPFLREKSLTSEPVGNFKTVEFLKTASGGRSIKHDQKHNPHELTRQSSSSISANRNSLLERSLRNVALSTRGSDGGGSLRNMEFLMHTEKPSDEHGLYDTETNKFEKRFSCFLWQRSYFYDHAYFAQRGWHLRWFTFNTVNGVMSSVPNRAYFEKHKITYPSFQDLEVDEERHIIRALVDPVEGRRNFHFMAPSDEILHEVLQKLEARINLRDSTLKETTTAEEGLVEKEEESDRDFEDGDPHFDLISFPVGGSNTEIFFFLFLYPLRFIMHWTIPDVRCLDCHGNPTGSLKQAFLAILACLVWLIIGSYAMVASLEALAALMDIPDAVVGVTVSAAGTSLPNYVASKVAAENGFGNMAVSNAFGSNTFNIMVGLGLPWVLYTSFATGFQPYHGLRDEGITESVLILGSVLAVFIVLVVPSGFIIYKWHGILFLVLYALYLAYEIGRVYINK